MRKQVELVVPKSLVRLVSVCALAAGLGACSEATRFTEAPFANPFRTAQAPAPQRDPVTTGSIRNAPPAGQPVAAAGNVSSQPLPPPTSAVALRSSAPPQAVSGSANGWSAQGGTPIVVAHGETLDVISGRYGVPRAALMQVNGLSSAEVTPGTRIVVPVYNGGGAQSAARQPAPSDNRFEQPRSAPPPVSRPVAAVAPAKSAAAPKAAAVDAKSQVEAKAQAAADAKVKAAADAKAMGEARARFAAEAKAKAAAKTASAPAAETKTAALSPAQPAKPKAAAPVVASAPAEKIPPQPKAVAPEPKAEPQTTASLPKAEEAPASNADFRWPARGRVIAGYAGKGGNEGINIAVPEGTPVKAAEGGVVAYAGSELKGYGNLVLIRHPNGYVSAYAHNGELNVKRGEQVKRGQVVAKSGQSGNVNSPQLHFELRKGSTPVDPVPYLSN
jgi:murein DD-endopeptidase MepM/ murein hydrolase activator NlpD